MNRIKILLIIVLLLPSNFIKAQKYVGGDISLLTKYEEHGANYMDKDGAAINDLLTFLKEQGMNAMRVRLFVDPSRASEKQQGEGVCQDIQYVKKLGKKIKDAGMKLMLDFHYSDTWADPGRQDIPFSWSVNSWGIDQSVYKYTKDCLEELVAAGATPDFIQTGNEISFGMLWGMEVNGQYEDWEQQGCHLEANSEWTGYTDKHWDNFTKCLKAAGNACREVCPEAKIIIHTEQAANTALVTDFYKRLDDNSVDYDIIGTSYYPYFHCDIAQLNTTITKFEQTFPSKQIMVVETGCGYRYKMGDKETGYPLTYEGQQKFTADLITMLNKHPNVNGLFWWFLEANEYGLDWSTKRVTDKWYDASLFDNETGRALPALYELKKFADSSASFIQPLSINGYKDTNWYDLCGRKLSETPKVKGVYINNKKKYVTK